MRPLAFGISKSLFNISAAMTLLCQDSALNAMRHEPNRSGVRPIFNMPYRVVSFTFVQHHKYFQAGLITTSNREPDQILVTVL
jgi:hypothetical protein